MGFKLASESKAYINSWIVNNRYVGKAEIFEMKDDKVKSMDYPETNMLLICQKVT